MADYNINYDDERFTEVESDKKAAINDLEKTYSGMINQSDGFYQKQVDAAKEWEQKQTELQNQQTDFTIDKIEQQKEQAKKDYTKEQSGAYADWQKQSNPYGVRAEQIADQGLQQSGYSESSQVSMYNTYQNRVATAREAYQRALLNYNNSITEARLQNNSNLAEIAYNSLQKQLELALEGFQNKNTLVLDKAKQKIQLEQIYHERWQDVLDQLNTENALAEEIRQFNESLAEEQRQFNFKNKLGEFAVKASSGGGSGGGSYYSGGGSSSKKSSSTGSASIKKSSGSSSGSSSSGLKLNAASVLSLGKGPISGNTAANMVKNGTATAKQVGNEIYLSKAPISTGKTSSISSSFMTFMNRKK